MDRGGVLKIPNFTATRFEHVITEGRTHPLVLACRSDEGNGLEHRLLVKGVGCPEVSSTWQLVTETVSNAVARRMGVNTPAPAVVELSRAMARMVNRSLERDGHSFKIQPGTAAGCEFIPGLAAFTVGQALTPELRSQAAKMFTFDMLSQNADRRRDKVNCGLSKSGLIAFDFELCFAHRFLPIIGGTGVEPCEPSKAMISKNHLFYQEVRTNPPSLESVDLMVSALSVGWWETLLGGLPEAWQPAPRRLGMT